MRHFVLLLLAIAHASALDGLAANRALLVGVAESPNLKNLDGYRPLSGPTNDVVLFYKMLTNFGIDPADITILATDRPKHIPTLTAIREELTRLAHQARPGDQVVVYLAGHGSRQPATEASLEDEPDGMDEVFLPADAAKSDLSSKYIENALVDDELGALLRSIREKGAFVWFVADCCHSGTITRGEQEAVAFREVPVELLFATRVIAELHPRTPGRNLSRGEISKSKIDWGMAADGLAGTGMVAMYACQPNQKTPELRLPPEGRTVHGLFTYTLCQVVQQAPQPLNHRELSEGILSHYSTKYAVREAWPYIDPLEGPAPETIVLRKSVWPYRNRLEMRRPNRSSPWFVQAGALVGLAPDAILRVFPPATALDDATALGYMRVTASDLFTARLEPIQYGGMPAPKRNVREGSRAEIISVPPGDARLNFALQTVDSPAASFLVCPPDADPVPVKAALRQITTDPQTGSLFHRTLELSSADLLLRWSTSSQRLELHRALPDGFPSGNLPPSSRSSSPPPLVCFSGQDVEAIFPLQQELQRIARGMALLKLITPPNQPAVARRMIGLELTINRHESTADTGGKLLGTPGQVRQVRPGDLLSFTIHNVGSNHLDVTVFSVAADFSIRCVSKTRSVPLPPGESRRSSRWLVQPGIYGPEHVIAIATPAGFEPRIDFSYLEQPGVRGTRSHTTDAELAALASHLERCMNGGATRSSGENDSRGFGDYVIKALPYVVIGKQ